MNDQITFQLFLTLWIVAMTAIYFKSKPSNYTRWMWLAGPVVALLPFFLPESATVFGEPILLPDVAAMIPVDREASYLNLIAIIYWIGVAVSLFGVVRRYLTLRRIKKSSIPKRVNGNTWYELPEAVNGHGAFSFFNWIFLPSLENDELRNCMYEHEAVHVAKKHSWDIAFVSVLRVVFWFNPFIALMRKGLKECHEFEADTKTAQLVGDTNYANALVSNAFGLKTIMPIVHPFGSVSNIKSRLTMLHSSKSPRLAWLWMIALCASFLSFQACTKSDARTSDQNGVSSRVGDQDATFPGGMWAMASFMAENIEYPESEKSAGTEGKVFVQFIVESDGTPTTPTIKKSLSAACDKAAMAAIAKMPKWNPAMKDGEAVAVEMVLPVLFKLED